MRLHGEPFTRLPLARPPDGGNMRDTLDPPGNANNFAADERSRAASRARFTGRCGAARGNNVEIPHPVETTHAWRVFYFRRMQGFHANGARPRWRGLPSGARASRAPRLP